MRPLARPCVGCAGCPPRRASPEIVLRSTGLSASAFPQLHARPGVFGSARVVDGQCPTASPPPTAGCRPIASRSLRRVVPRPRLLTNVNTYSNHASSIGPTAATRCVKRADRGTRRPSHGALSSTPGAARASAKPALVAVADALVAISAGRSDRLAAHPARLASGARIRTFRARQPRSGPPSPCR